MAAEPAGLAAGFAAAWAALTRVPAPPWPAAALRHFPLVGALIGGLGALVLWSAAHLWPASVAVGLALAAVTAFTSASGERGLAAACDGGTRLGAGGLVGVVALTGLHAVALHALALRDFAGALVALPLLHGLSRGTAGLAVHALPGMRAARPWVLAAMLLLAGGAAAAGWDLLHLGLAAVAQAGVAAVVARGVRQRGGDAAAAFGAAQQAAALVALLVLLAARTQG